MTISPDIPVTLSCCRGSVPEHSPVRARLGQKDAQAPAHPRVWDPLPHIPFWFLHFPPSYPGTIQRHMLGLDEWGHRVTPMEVAHPKFPASSHEPLKLLGVDWSHWPRHPGPSLMRGVPIIPMGARCSLDVHTCVLSIRPRGMEQQHSPCTLFLWHPPCLQKHGSPQAVQGGKGSGQTSGTGTWQHRRQRQQVRPVTGRSKSWPRHSPGWERASGRGIRPPTASRERAREEAELGEQRVHDRQSG